MNTEKPVREPLPRGFWVIWSTVALDMVGFQISALCALHAECHVDGAAELGGVLRVGGVARALQAAGETLHRTDLVHRLVVARAVADEAGVVAERVGVGVVGAELGGHFARLAVDVFGGGDFGHFALPAAGGLDAEQVEGR